MSRSEAAAAVAVPEDLVELGRVTDAYGLQGWVKIQPYSADSSALLHARHWWLRRTLTPVQQASREVRQGTPWPMKVVKSRTQGSSIVGSLQGVADRTEAERLRGCTVWVSRAAFPALEDDEYYWIDLIGCLVYGEQDGRGVLLGVVDSVMDNGAHAVLRVKRQVPDEQGIPVPLLDDKGRNIEALIPFVAAHVHTVDLAGRRLDSNWPADF